MGGGQSSSTSETKEVRLPQWVEDAGKANYARATGIANQGFNPYKGDRVADLSPEFYQAQGLLPTLDDYYQNYASGTDYLNQVGQYKPTDVKGYDASQFAGTDLNPYLNPYIENVERRAIDNATRSGNIAQTNLAAGAPARGGSREAIRAGVQQAETTRGIGDLSGKLRKEGFDTATGLAMKDIEARNAQKKFNVETQLENEKYRQGANDARIRAAAGLTDTANDAQSARMNEIAQYLGIGQIGQEQEQREIDDKIARHGEKRDWDLENLNILLATLGLTPYGHTETSMSKSKSSGGGQGGAAIAGGLGLLSKLLSGGVA